MPQSEFRVAFATDLVQNITVVLGADRHLSDDQVERLSMKQMAGDEAASSEEHLLICEQCRKKVAAADAYVRAMRRAAAAYEDKPPPPVPGLFQRLVPAVAALGIVLLVAVALRLFRPEPPPPTSVVPLAATGGADVAARAPAGAPLLLQPDLTGLEPGSSYRLEIVDRGGNRVWRGSTAAAKTPPVQPGSYWVRVYSAAGALLREYNLQIETRK